MEHRAAAPFKNVEDVKLVKGIGDKLFAKMLPKWLPQGIDLSGIKPNGRIVADSILGYAKDNCLDSDERLAVLDIYGARLFRYGRCVEIRNGVVSGSEARFCFAYDCGYQTRYTKI